MGTTGLSYKNESALEAGTFMILFGSFHLKSTVGVGGMAYFFGNVFEFCTWVLFWEAFYIRTTNQKQFFDLRHFPSNAPPENTPFPNFHKFSLKIKF